MSYFFFKHCFDVDVIRPIKKLFHSLNKCFDTNSVLN